jgi:hypothetical protein
MVLDKMANLEKRDNKIENRHSNLQCIRMSRLSVVISPIKEANTKLVSDFAECSFFESTEESPDIRGQTYHALHVQLHHLRI